MCSCFIYLLEISIIFLDYLGSINSIFTGWSRIPEGKAPRKMSTIVYATEMFLEPPLLRLLPMRLLQSDQIILGYQIVALFQILLAM